MSGKAGHRGGMYVKFEYEHYKPPQAAVEVAERRCRPIMRGWAFQLEQRLEVLMVSCYLQGVADAGRALAINGVSLKEEEL